jgi:aldose sugar dehydrogenase
MRRTVSFIALVVFASVLGTLLVAQPRRQPPPRAAETLYKELCASCHGPNLSGGMAPSMLDDAWRFGADDASIATSIRDGRPEAGMPPMGGALTEQEVRAMVIFIREEGAKFRRSQAAIPKPEGDAIVQSERHAFKVETVVARGVEEPWGIAFLPDGRMLVTEKNGRLRIVQNGTLVTEPVAGIPEVWPKGQGGLLDVAVHPAYEKNGWIYLSYSDPGEGDSAMTAVVRGKLRDGQFVEQQEIFKAPPKLYRNGPVHFGSRFVFDGKGHLFFSIGERGHKEDAQDLSRPNGKVHRVHEDGRVPQDNPFANKAGAFQTIWSYGNRNPQGLAQHPETGELWAAEHGPRGGDELNLIEPGKNYGWPVITYGMNYDGTPITDKTAQEGMEQPIIHWTPSIAVCAIDFYRGDQFPGWRNDLLVGALAQQEVRRVVINGRKVTHQEVLFTGAGRVRDVVVGPDGLVYIAFNGPDRIARLVPHKEGTR